MIWGFVIPIAYNLHDQSKCYNLVNYVYLAFVLFLLQSYSLLSSNNSGVRGYVFQGSSHLFNDNGLSGTITNIKISEY